MASAFDKISHGNITTEIVALTGKPAWGVLIASYLRDGDIHLGSSKTYRKIGIPQGGVLAPVCFSAATWRTAKKISCLSGPYRIEVALFADDICIKILAAGILGLCQGLVNAHGVLMGFCASSELDLDPTKSESITDSDRTTSHVVSVLSNTELQFIADGIKPSMKWLGYWITPGTN